MKEYPQKLQTVLLLHIKILDFPERLGTVLIQSGQRTEIQIDPRQFHLVAGELLILIGLQDLQRFLVPSLQVFHIGLVHLVLRIQGTGFPQLVQDKMGASRIILEIQASFFIVYIILYQGKASFLFCSAQIRPHIGASGRRHRKNKFLIGASHNDLASLDAVFQPVRMDHIFNTAGTADELVLCEHMAFCFQKTAPGLHIQSQMSPSASADLELFLNRLVKFVVFRLCRLQGYLHRVFLFQPYEEFFQMLVGNRLSGQSRVQSFVAVSCLRHYHRKGFIGKKAIRFPEIAFRDLTEGFHILDLSPGTVDLILLCLYHKRNFVLPCIGCHAQPPGTFFSRFHSCAVHAIGKADRSPGKSAVSGDKSAAGRSDIPLDLLIVLCSQIQLSAHCLSRFQHDCDLLL